MTPGRDVQSETVTRGSSEAFRRSLCYVDADFYLNNSPEKESKGAQDSSSYMGCGQPHSREKSTSTTVLGVDKRDAGSIALDELAGLCPANGFKAANSERNLEFHRRFRDIPDRDMLAEDYGCALQKEIICAGRVYISDGHICFRSNILGWSTSLIVRFADVVAIEKTSTAMIFPNAIAVLTSHDRHVFRSLRNREATYMLLTNIWKTNIPAFRTPTEGRARISRDGDYLSRDRGKYQSTVTPVKFNKHTDLAWSKPRGIQDTAFLRCLIPMSILRHCGAFGHSTSSLALTASSHEFGWHERVVSRGVVPGLLEKLYCLVYGPSSGSFICKLVKNQGCMNFSLRSRTTNLSRSNRTRKYSYNIPVTGFLSPCIQHVRTEHLEFLDNQRGIEVTVITDTLGSPNGVIPRVRSRYVWTCGSMSETLLRVFCSIEWHERTWLRSSIEEHCLLAEAAIADELIRSLTAAVISRDHTDAPLIKVESTGKNGDAHGQSDGSIIARLLSWRDFRSYPALFQHKFLRFCVVVAWVWTAMTSLETLQTHVHHNALPNTQSRHPLSCPHDRASMVQLESDPILEGSFGRLGHWEHNSCRMHSQDLRERMDTDAWSDEDLDNAICTERIRLAALEGFVWNRDYKRNG